MSEPRMTPGERAVWAAVYAATWAALRQTARGRLDGDLGPVASEAADEAWGAVEELRTLARGDGDFAAEARDVIQGSATP